MTAWILTHADGLPMDENMFDLYIGFKELNEDVKFYNTADVILNTIPVNENDIVVGHVDQCRRMFQRHNVPEPEYIDYPDELKHYMRRNYWKETLKEFYLRLNKEDYQPLFIKSVRQKLFTGFVCKNKNDYLRICDLPDDTEIWVSELMEFVSEFRIYIHHHNIIGCIRYKGSPYYAPRQDRVEAMLYALRNANMPVAYSIDVGIIRGEPFSAYLVECNDAFALGNYGINPRDYAAMLRDRWYQIIRNKQ